MSEVERLAVEQAIYNAIGRDVRTGDPQNLRGAVTAYYLGLYEDTGATGFDVRISGESVGRFTFPKVKGRPERTEERLEVTNMAELFDWMDGATDFWEWLREYAAKHADELALAYARDTGELPDGVEWVTHTEPAVPETINEGGRLTVDAAKVAEAMGEALPSAIIGLLEGSGDE